MINELGRLPTRSKNVYFANNEQASTAVFTAMFCFTHAELNLFKLILYKLYNNWSAKAVNSISEWAMWNSKKPIKSVHL